MVDVQAICLMYEQTLDYLTGGHTAWEVTNIMLQIIHDATEKGQSREKDRYMWGFGIRPNPHIYPFPVLEGDFFSALIHNVVSIRAIIRHRI
jgi:hypothetical protein